MKLMAHCCLIIALWISTWASADTIKIASFPIPLMVESAEKGVFVDLLKEIERRIPHEFEFSVYPTKRTVKLFHDGNIDAFFPALDVVLGKPVQRSSNIYIKEDFAFVTEGNPPPTSVAALTDMKVGITAGYPYVAEVMALPNLAEANTDVANMKKLSGNRIDVFVVEEKSGLKALEQSGVGNVNYNSEAPLSKQDVYYAFQDTPEGEAYAKAFSDALDAMKKDGTFAEIMSRAGK